MWLCVRCLTGALPVQLAHQQADSRASFVAGGRWCEGLALSTGFQPMHASQPQPFAPSRGVWSAYGTSSRGSRLGLAAEIHDSRSYLRPNFHHFGLFILISSGVIGGGTGGRDSSVRKLPDSVSYGVTPRRRLISITIGIDRGPSFR
jgi:hypothetical protein